MRSFHRCPAAWLRSISSKRDPTHPDRKYTVSGTPYILTNSATTKAEKPPSSFQSRALEGRKKLTANAMNKAVFTTTRAQSPYAFRSQDFRLERVPPAGRLIQPSPVVGWGIGPYAPVGMRRWSLAPPRGEGALFRHEHGG